jgi:succinoglycan biosynthesis transport protein ExoP
LTTILLGRATAEDVVQRWRDSSLFVLAAGQIPPNPSELLGSEPMEELFVKLRHDYDFILIDSPPVVPVIDAVIVDRLTGGLLMVVAVDRTKKRDLSSALKSLDTVGVKVSGFTLNMTPVKSSQKYRYGYHRYEAEAARSRASSRRSRRAAASRG